MCNSGATSGGTGSVLRTFASYLVTALSALPLLTPAAKAAGVAGIAGVARATITTTTTHCIAGVSKGQRVRMCGR